MSEIRSCVTLKRAAQTLGVHEQTLRSWEKRGLIRLVRLPGSGYRRVPLEEIERLQAEMGISVNAPRVRVIPPLRDPESLAQARVLANAVRAELADLETEITFDEFMASRRGRQWSS